MAPSGIEDSSLTLCSNPGPRFFCGASSKFALASGFENDSSLGIMFVVNVGFVPAFEAFKALHQFMIGSDNCSTKTLATMLFELPAR